MVQQNIFERPQEGGGSIEVICGSMFSGKTEEMIRRLNRARIANLNVQIFKPTTDTRYADDAIVSHNLQSFPCLTVDCSNEILAHTHHQVIAIDEAQFLDNELAHVCNNLANQGIRVIVAGLDMDYKGFPFGPIPAVMAIAESVTKLHAVCVKCGKQALYSYRTCVNKETILLGEKDRYEPRCRACYGKS